MPPTPFVFLSIFGLGPVELGIIGLIVVVFFGAARLPQLARALGSAKREFAAGAEDDAEREPK